MARSNASDLLRRWFSRPAFDILADARDMLISSNLIVGNGRGSYRTNCLHSTKEVRIGTGKNGNQLAVERLTSVLAAAFYSVVLPSSTSTNGCFNSLHLVR